MKLRKIPNGFTLIELLVVISIIAILASVAVPATLGAIAKGKQIKDLLNAKEVHKALLAFAGDHDGAFPSQKDQDGNTPTDLTSGSLSNDAYANLIPRYIGVENVFWLAGSAWCKLNPPDENISDGFKLGPGENNYAYVCGLNSSSNPNFPVVADGFSDTVGAYTVDPNRRGGVWKGETAIVVRVGGAASKEIVRSDSHRVFGNTGLTSKQDIFTYGGGSSDNPWLSADRNFILNPTPAN